MAPDLPNGCQILPMDESHLERVRAVELACYPFPWSEGIFRDCLKSGYLCRIVEDTDGRLCAYAVVTVAAGECHVLNICVDLTLRGQGIARTLLRRILDEAALAGAREAFLEVRPTNPAAIRLYETFGFRQVGRRRNYYPHRDGREDAIVMALAL